VPSPVDPRFHELNHKLYMAQGVAERQADLIQQLWRVVQNHSRNLEQVTRLANDLVKENGSTAPRGVPRSDPTAIAASALRIGECPDKSVWFQFDNDGHWFTMQPRLCGLLEFLASEPDEESGSDKLAGFRSRSAILAHLETTGQRRYDAQYVNKLVKKLRDRLSQYDRQSLVVSSDKDGVRILMRRDGIERVRLDHAPKTKRPLGIAFGQR
jgi:hypothetical protein